MPKYFNYDVTLSYPIQKSYAKIVSDESERDLDMPGRLLEMAVPLTISRHATLTQHEDVSIDVKLAVDELSNAGSDFNTSPDLNGYKSFCFQVGFRSKGILLKNDEVLEAVKDFVSRVPYMPSLKQGPAGLEEKIRECRTH